MKKIVSLFVVVLYSLVLKATPTPALVLDRGLVEKVKQQKVPAEILAAIPPAPTNEKRAMHGLTPSQLIKLGRFIFNNVTFGGNGRTCATCHPETHNFTIDPEFIATLPPTDPLFVAETIPALKDLENPVLMRSLGLICEILTGLTSPASSG